MGGSVLSSNRRADCESIALELREELKLTAAQRLDPRVLAEYLGIPVLPLDAFVECAPAAVAQLRDEFERSSFSAVTAGRGRRRMIVYHPDHGRDRPANIAHELAHVVLEHEPAPLPLYDREGRRNSINPREECEADYLGGALLAPRCVVRLVMGRCDGDRGRAAAHFEISEKLMGERVRAAETAEKWAAREVATMLRMTEEEMGIVRRLSVKRGQLGDWEGSPV